MTCVREPDRAAKGRIVRFVEQLEGRIGPEAVGGAKTGRQGGRIVRPVEHSLAQRGLGLPAVWTWPGRPETRCAAADPTWGTVAVRYTRT